MNAHARGRTTELAVMMCILVLILIAAVAPRSDAGVLSTPADDGVSIRFEGYLKAIGPGKWLVGESFVLVDTQTIIIEKHGRAEVGAWVVVWGLQSQTGAIYGELIQVERPAGNSGPIWQFSGVVSKHIVLTDGIEWWVINGLAVQSTRNTQFRGTPDTGWLVWVVAEYQETFFRALVIEAIAETPESVPVEFEGALEAYGPDGGQIDGHAFILAEEPVIIGEPAVGLRVQVRATQKASGLLVVYLLRVVETPSLWTWRHGIDMDPSATQVDVALPDSPAPAAPAGTRGPNAAAAPWGTPELVIDGLTDAARPALANTGDGTTHALWESGGDVFWATRTPGQGWSQAERIASGSEPTLAVDSAGHLHVLFTKQFMENYEIYHVMYTEGSWTLPINVAHTSGVSTEPALAAGKDGRLHATWMDDTPGYPIIYSAKWSYSTQWSGFVWRNQPIPYGRGQSPAIAVAQDETIFLAWQDLVPTIDNPTGFSNIFLSEWQEDSWSLPINISDREDVDAEEVSITTTADGLAHLVWIEDTRSIRYDFGQGRSWPLPRTIATASVLARGPRIATEDGYFMHIAWDEAATLRATSAPRMSAIWPTPVVVTTLLGTLKDVGLNVTQENEMTLTWVQISQTGETSIYESRCERLNPHRIWLPAILNGQ